MDHAPLSPDVGGFTVVYDPDGAFCTWCRAWLEAQAVLVPVRFTPAGGAEAQARLGVLGAGAELVVVADDGRAWTGAAAFVMCLWATARHRDLAFALRLPVARMGAEAFFHAVTANRAILDRLLAFGPSAARSGGPLGPSAARSGGPLGPSAGRSGGSLGPQPQACAR